MKAEIERLKASIRAEQRLRAEDAASHLDEIERLTAEKESLSDALASSEVACQQAEAALQTARAELNELVMAVAMKYPGESRYQTALRYIREREDRSSTEVRAAEQENSRD